MPVNNFNVPDNLNPEDHHMVSIGQISIFNQDIAISIETCAVQHDPAMGISKPCKVMAMMPDWTNPNDAGDPDSDEFAVALVQRARQVTALLALWGTEPFKQTMQLLAEGARKLGTESNFEGAYELAQSESDFITRDALRALQADMQVEAYDMANQVMNDATEHKTGKPAPDSVASVVKDLFGEDMTEELRPS